MPEDRGIENANAVVEEVADAVHAVWANWMRYQFSIGQFNDDGTWTMPRWAVERWTRQMNTDYRDLPKDERASDIDIAAQYIDLIHSVESAERDDAVGRAAEFIERWEG